MFTRDEIEAWVLAQVDQAPEVDEDRGQRLASLLGGAS